MKKYLLILALCLQVVWAQFPPKGWDKVYGTPNAESMTCAIRTADKGLLMGSSMTGGPVGHKTQPGQGLTDYWILKTDSVGTIEWDLTLGGSDYDELTALAQTPDGGYILAGNSKSPVSGDKQAAHAGTLIDYWIVKINPNRTIAWQKTFGGDANDKVAYVRVDAQGNIYLGGHSQSRQNTGNKTTVQKGTNDMWVHKLNADGIIIWEASIGGQNDDYLYAFATTGDGGVIVGGNTYSQISGDKNELGMGGLDAWIIKLNNLGQIEWQNAVGGAGNETVYSLLPTPDGGYIAGITSNSNISSDKAEPGFGLNDYWIVKLNNIGAIQWNRTYGGPADDNVASIIPDGDGYLAVGTTLSGIGGTRDLSLHGGSDIWVLRLDPGGSLTWQMLVGGTGNDRGIPLRAPNGNFVIAGSSDSPVGFEKSVPPIGGTDFWVINYLSGNPNGGTQKTFTVSGKVYHDLNNNCLNDTEAPLPYTLVRSSEGIYAITNAQGVYTLKTKDMNERTYSPVVPRYWSHGCPDHTFHFGNVGPVSEVADFGLKQDTACALLRVSMGAGMWRRCFDNNTYVISYCNEGNVTSEAAWIEADFDDLILPVSSTVPWTTPVTGNRYRFDLGQLAPGQCGTIKVQFKVLCNAPIGKVLCSKVQIYPHTPCGPVSNEWDKSSVKVEGKCEDNVAVFTIVNTGEPGNGDMDAPSQYRIYIDNALATTGTFQLAGGDTLTIRVAATSDNIRLEADQRPGHPGHSRPRATVSDCKAGYVSIQALTAAPMDEEDAHADSDCGAVRGSMDPNDKQVTPAGITDNHYVPTGSTLDYLIRFQNVGNDTAFTVVVRDTLDTDVDLASLKVGAASHPFVLTIEGRTLVWTFNNIKLVDSTTNEPESHGWLRFSIGHHADLLPKTQIDNRAGIFFDFNDPIITNYASVQVFDTTLVTTQAVLVSTQLPAAGPRWAVYPNPADHLLHLQTSTPATYRLLNSLGQPVLQGTAAAGTTPLPVQALPPGVYLMELNTGPHTAHQKVVIQ